jgi:ADP-ribose pyrophosphatase YjhB (NUDIX family)
MSVSVGHELPKVAVGAIVLEHRGDGPFVLLVQRANPPLAARWSLPGGRVERGEKLADALRREVREETGLEVKIGVLVEVVELIDEGFHYVILDYACERTSGELRAGDDAHRVEMVSVFDLAEYGVTSDVLRVVSRALADDD